MAASTSESRSLESQLMLECTVGDSQDETISSIRLVERLAALGLSMTTDERLSAIRKRLQERAPFGAAALSMDDISYIFQKGTDGRLLVQRAVERKLTVPEWSSFCSKLKEIYEEVKQMDGGPTVKNAQYIPELRENIVDPNQFAISVCTVDGQTWSYGDSANKFCIQSCCKPINYLIARTLRGKETVHEHIGHEPSGHLFNNLSLKDYSDDKKIPHNPMINAGAMMACSLIKPDDSMADRFKHVMQIWKKLMGNRDAGFANEVYLSEKATANQNWALAYMMMEHNAFEDTVKSHQELEKHLQFYFQCCSITSTCSDMATMAATLASGGKCPLTDEVVFQPDDVRDCLSMMMFSGMYDYSGEWGYKIGMPAKSGVGGCVYVVIPNKMGIAIWSPPLDAHGNSFKSVEFCKKIVERFNFHNFDTLTGVKGKSDPTSNSKKEKRTDITEILFVAAEGDLKELVHLTSTNPDLLYKSDYDKRTAMHLAACEGNAHILRWIIQEAQTSGGDAKRLEIVNAQDRWSRTPMDDALTHKHEECVAILKAYSRQSVRKSLLITSSMKDVLTNIDMEV